MTGKPMARIAAVSLAAWFFAIGAASAAGSDEKVWKQVEMVRIWKLAEVLDLSEEEMSKVIPVVKDYNAEMRKRALERESILSALQKEFHPGGEKDRNDKPLRDDVRRVLALESEMMSIRQDHFKKMEKILSAEKLAKYMVFEVRFHDELQNFMSDMSRRKAKRNLKNQKDQPAPTPNKDAGEKK